MIYVCLLRGINVGGNNKVSMKELKVLMESHGFFNVETYINSGNIIFESDSDIHDIELKIHNLIFENLNVDSKVLILTKTDFIKIANSIPAHFKNDDSYKADVLFYYPDINMDLIDELTFKEGIDEVIMCDCALIHGTLRVNQTRSALLKIVGTKFYFHVTIRNVNTVRKMKELLIKD